MTDINRSILIGRLTRDPELRYTPSGAAVASFTIANGRTFTQAGEKKEQTSFIDCVAWQKTGEIIAEYCKKGHRIAIEGRLTQRRWTDAEGNNKSKLEIVAESIQFLQGKTEGAQEAPQGQTQQTQQNIMDGAPVTDPDFDNPFSDDDIPF